LKHDGCTKKISITLFYIWRFLNFLNKNGFTKATIVSPENKDMK